MKVGGPATFDEVVFDSEILLIRILGFVVDLLIQQRLKLGRLEFVGKTHDRRLEELLSTGQKWRNSFP